MHVLKLFGISKASDCLEHFQIIREKLTFLRRTWYPLEMRSERKVKLKFKNSFYLNHGLLIKLCLNTARTCSLINRRNIILKYSQVFVFYLVFLYVILVTGIAKIEYNTNLNRKLNKRCKMNIQSPY